MFPDVIYEKKKGSLLWYSQGTSNSLRQKGKYAAAAAATDTGTLKHCTREMFLFIISSKCQ